MTRQAGTGRTGAAVPRLRPQLSDEVATYLRELIMSGQARPGQFIRLDEVARELDVSATPVREALLTLRGEDMVELEPRRGYLVTPLSKQDIQDVFWLQGEIASELAARAARRMTPEHLSELRAVQQQLEQAAQAGRSADIARLEFEFHRTINRLTESRKLSWFLQNAMRYTPAKIYTTDPAWRAKMLLDHETMLAAFAKGDVKYARSAMTAHFSDGADRLIRHLDEQRVWDQQD